MQPSLNDSLLRIKRAGQHIATLQEFETRINGFGPDELTNRPCNLRAALDYLPHSLAWLERATAPAPNSQSVRPREIGSPPSSSFVESTSLTGNLASCRSRSTLGPGSNSWPLFPTSTSTCVSIQRLRRTNCEDSLFCRPRHQLVTFVLMSSPNRSAA